VLILNLPIESTACIIVRDLVLNIGIKIFGGYPEFFWLFADKVNNIFAMIELYKAKNDL
jgi:hypothetical protein